MRRWNRKRSNTPRRKPGVSADQGIDGDLRLLERAAGMIGDGEHPLAFAARENEPEDGDVVEDAVQGVGRHDRALHVHLVVIEIRVAGACDADRGTVGARQLDVEAAFGLREVALEAVELEALAGQHVDEARERCHGQHARQDRGLHQAEVGDLGLAGEGASGRRVVGSRR